jgi:hypothetical protein
MTFWSIKSVGSADNSHLSYEGTKSQPEIQERQPAYCSGEVWKSDYPQQNSGYAD